MNIIFGSGLVIIGVVLIIALISSVQKTRNKE